MTLPYFLSVPAVAIILGLGLGGILVLVLLGLGLGGTLVLVLLGLGLGSTLILVVLGLGLGGTLILIVLGLGLGGTFILIVLGLGLILVAAGAGRGILGILILCAKRPVRPGTAPTTARLLKCLCTSSCFVSSRGLISRWDQRENIVTQFVMCYVNCP